MPWLWLLFGAGLGAGAYAIAKPADAPEDPGARLHAAQLSALGAVHVVLQEISQHGCATRASIALMQRMSNEYFALFLTFHRAELAQDPTMQALASAPPMRTDGYADPATVAGFHALTGGALLACELPPPGSP